MARSVAISTAVFAFCNLEIALSWRHSRLPDRMNLVLGQAVTVIVLTALWTFAKCLRERILLVLVALQTAAVLGVGIITSESEAAMSEIKPLFRAIWLLCAVVSLTLVISAVQNARMSTKLRG